MSARAYIELKEGRVDEVDSGDREANDEGHLDVSRDVGAPAFTEALLVLSERHH